MLLSAGLAMTLLVLLGSAAIGAAPRAAAQPSARDFATSEVTPDDVLAYINIPLDQESEQWALAQELLDRSGLSEAFQASMEESTGGQSLEDLPLDVIVPGEVAIVITDAALEAAIRAASEASGGTAVEEPAVEEVDAPAAAGVALILEANAPDTAFAAAESALEQQADDSGNDVEETDYEGVTIQSVAAAEDGSTPGAAIAQLDDFVLAAPTAADLEPIIDTADSGNSLADFEPYDEIRAEFDQDFLLFGFFNGVAAAGVQEQLGGLGLSSTAIGTTNRFSALWVHADDQGFRFETAAIAAEGESLSPAAANFESELAARTPSDALFFLNASDLGRTGVLDAIGAGLIAVALSQSGQEAPSGQTPEEFIAAQYEQAAQVLGFNLQTELFQQLVGEYALWFSAGSDPSDVSALLVSGVEDPGTVVNALSQLTLLIQGAAGGTASVTTRQIGGDQVSVIDTGDPTAPALEYGIVDDHFVFGVGTAVDDFADGPVDSLADDAQFQDVMATLPEDVNGMLYVNLASIIPLLQEAASSASAPTAVEEIVDASPDCANYETQEEAQEAYDAGEEGTFDLDQDFDGEVCEDFFADEDSGVGLADLPDEEAQPFVADLSAITAFALVAYDEGGVRHTSSILYIEE
jgi:hypothetical protein